MVQEKKKIHKRIEAPLVKKATSVAKPKLEKLEFPAELVAEAEVKAREVDLKQQEVNRRRAEIRRLEKICGC